MTLSPRLKRILFFLLPLLILTAILFLGWLRTAPGLVRLLPDGQAFFYADFGTLQKLGSLRNHPAADLSPDYAQFVSGTGFNFERDLKELAVSLDGARPGDPRTTMLARLHYDKRLPDYLRQHSRSVVNYNNCEIFEIPVGNHVERAALLSSSLLALSNEDDPGVLHALIDRQKSLLPHWRAPNLVANHYTELPHLSFVWVIAQMQPPHRALAGSVLAGSVPAGSAPLAGGFGLRPSAPSTLLFSLGFRRQIEARAQFLFASPSEADQYASQIGSLLGIFHTLQNALPQQGSDSDVRALFGSLNATEERQSVTLHASIPIGFLQKLLQEETRGAAAPAPSPANTNAASPARPAH